MVADGQGAELGAERAERVIFCADIFHTQGASMYTFRSYLSIVVRAVKVLAPIPVSAVIPVGSTRGAWGFGFDLGAGFSNESLQGE